MPDHLRPTAAIARAALLPGDPARAMALARDLLDRPLMANHARGLWGYTAATPSGLELTIQSTGIGGPSVAVVVEELAELGVARAIRIGTCTAIGPALRAGALVVAERALAIASNGAPPPRPDAELTGALLGAGAGLSGVAVAETDRYYEPAAARAGALAAGASAVDLATSAMLETAGRVGIAAASALVVSRDAGGTVLSDEELEAASLRLGRAASAALGA